MAVVKYLASSLTLLGPILRLGSSGMSCNLSLVSGVLLLRGTVTVAFPASTLLLDPVSLGRLQGYGGSGCEAMGGADTGLGRCCSMTLCIMRISCFAPPRMLLVTACPSLSHSWLRRDLRDLSTSRISGDVDVELLDDVWYQCLGLWRLGKLHCWMCHLSSRKSYCCFRWWSPYQLQGIRATLQKALSWWSHLSLAAVLQVEKHFEVGVTVVLLLGLECLL